MRRWCGQGTEFMVRAARRCFRFEGGVAEVGFSGRATETLAEDGNRRVSADARRSQRWPAEPWPLAGWTHRTVATPRAADDAATSHARGRKCVGGPEAFILNSRQTRWQTSCGGGGTKLASASKNPPGAR
jgi:hypothetical protein